MYYNIGPNNPTANYGCLNSSSFWARTARGAYSGLMTGILCGGISSVVSNENYPIFYGIIGGVIFGAIGGMIYHECNKEPEDREEESLNVSSRASTVVADDDEPYSPLPTMGRV